MLTVADLDTSDANHAVRQQRGWFAVIGAVPHLVRPRFTFARTLNESAPVPRFVSPSTYRYRQPDRACDAVPSPRARHH